MGSSYVGRFVISLVLILTIKRTIASKVVTRFLKVPWMNLNSSWRDEVTSQCKNDVTTLFQSADAGEMWALKMLDASSKIPSGILMGNIVDLGLYDECVRVKGQKNIAGQHCMVSLSIPSKFVDEATVILREQMLSIYNPAVGVDLSLTLSTCLPSSCRVKDVIGFVNSSIQSVPEFSEFEVRVARATCSDVESADDLTMGTILTLSFFAAIACVLLFCTVCDYLVRTNPENSSAALKTLAKFSPYTNAINLFSTETAPGTMPAIHGLRFLSTFFIVADHRFILTVTKPIVNLSDMDESRQSALGSLFIMLLYAVDTFFVISGFLVTYLFLKRMQSGVKFNLFKFYLHRYVRLAPCMGISLLCVIFIGPRVVSGPMSRIFLNDAIGHCRNNWWANLLFVQNLSHRREMCMLHSWHSAAEMQFFVLSPIILYPLFHRPKLGLTMLAVLLVVSFITPAVQVVISNYGFLYDIGKPYAQNMIDACNSYTVTYHRALPYLVGILLAYDVVNNKRRFTKVQAAANWILVCILVALCFWNTRFLQPVTLDHHMGWETVYVSLGRLAWSLAMAWILYACTQGYGGLVTRFLSLPIFVPLSRLSYGIYLVHFLIQIGLNVVQRTAESYALFAAVHMVWGDLATSVAVAFVINVCIETPAVILEQVVRGEQPAAITSATALQATDVAGLEKRPATRDLRKR